MSDSIRLSSVAVNCPDSGALAAFYADITGGRVVIANDEWATVDGPGGRIDFQTVPDHVPPSWPDPSTPVQQHLDFFVDDLAAAGARVSRPVPPATTPSRTPSTAWCSPTPPVTRSASPPGTTSPAEQRAPPQL